MTREYQKRATQKWNKKKYDSIAIRLPKGSREKMKEWAEQAGLSLAAFLRGGNVSLRPSRRRWQDNQGRR